VRDFCVALQELSFVYDGVGLAAPQIGRSERIIFVTQRNTKPKKRELIREEVMINPEILSISNDQEIDEEGCLSLPGVKADVARAKKITVSYLSSAGKKMRLTAE
jgi:peptide deformylase